MPRGSLPSWGAPIARHEGPPEPRQRRSQRVLGVPLQHRHHRSLTPAVPALQSRLSHHRWHRPGCPAEAPAGLLAACSRATGSLAAQRRRWSPAPARSARPARSWRTGAANGGCPAPGAAGAPWRPCGRTPPPSGRSPHRTGPAGRCGGSGSRRSARGAPAARCARRLRRVGLAGASRGRNRVPGARRRTTLARVRAAVQVTNRAASVALGDSQPGFDDRRQLTSARP
jgi:hypothetical protein